MLPQTENTKQFGGESPTLNDVGVTKSPRKRWLGLAIAVIVPAALLASGIWSRVRARTALDAVTARVAVPAVSVVTPNKQRPPRRSSFPEMYNRSLLHRS